MVSNLKIPARAFFFWSGTQFPWVNVLALRSAALRGGFDQVVLHHDSDLSHTPHFAELVGTPKITLKRLDLDQLFTGCAPYTSELQTVWSRLHTPATRSDLYRYAVLYAEGGVYLDIDTITLRSFQPLCAGVSAFCGKERIVYPAGVRTSKNPVVRGEAFLRDRVRDLLRRLPRGYRTFKKIEHLYPLAANAAILGSEAKSPFVTRTMEMMFSVDPAVQPLPNGIGPHLVQKSIAAYQGNDLAIHDSAVFFPLGPEISQHWFRLRPSVDLSEVISDATHLVHWYGSVRTKELVKVIDPTYVRQHQHTQFFSALAAPFLA